MIIDGILFLLTYKGKHPEEVSLEIRQKATINSLLPVTMVSLMHFASIKIYDSILEIMYNLSFQPYFGKNGYLLFLLLRKTTMIP